MLKRKLIRITTVPLSLKTLLKGQLKFMSSYFDVSAVSSGGEELNQVGKEEGVNIIPIDLTRKITPLKDFISLIKMYVLLKTEKPLIVHTHTPKAGIIGMLASKLAGVPIRLHTVAGLPLLEASGLKRKILNFVEKITYSCATNIYPNSQGLFHFIVQNKFAVGSKVKVIGNGSSNGINTDFFDCDKVDPKEIERLRNELKIEESDFVWIFVGRIVGDKGINELISAFKTLKDSINNVSMKLLLVGSQEIDLDPLHPKTINEINSNPNIISVGFQKDVRPYFAISSALVFPSYREGFPNVVMQAGSMAIPSLVSDINGCNEIIIDGQNGLLFPVKDCNAILQAMNKILINREMYLKLKENSRKLIVDRYEQKVMWEKILNEYLSLINKNEFKDV